jgi:Cu-Zn family superoxide dismutase
MKHTIVRAAAVAGLTLGLAVAVLPAYADSARVVTARGPLTVYADPYGDGTPNPADGGSATVLSFTTAGVKTIVTLRVRGLAPDREFGAHAHVLGCTDTQGGGHYQNVPGTANDANEIWLDFTTNSSGTGVAHTQVDWAFRADGANSVVIHDHATDPAGTAGPKLACLDVQF